MRLASVLRKWRIMSELPLRSAAKGMGISAATLLRIENGHVCDGATLAKILTWLLNKEKR
jgi:transcriptional regulator with XRE-family HTH domain